MGRPLGGPLGEPLGGPWGKTIFLAFPGPEICLPFLAGGFLRLSRAERQGTPSAAIYKAWRPWGAVTFALRVVRDLVNSSGLGPQGAKPCK